MSRFLRYLSPFVSVPVFGHVGDPHAKALLEHLEPALAAALLLARWRVPGARERLVERLRRSDDTWLFDWLTGAFVPPGLRADLAELAAREPGRCGERVRALLGYLESRRAWEGGAEGGGS